MGLGLEKITKAGHEAALHGSVDRIHPPQEWEGNFFPLHEYRYVSVVAQDSRPPGFRTIGQTLQPCISPKQKMNRSHILLGSCSSGIGVNPNVL